MTKTELIEKMAKEMAVLHMEKELALQEVNNADTIAKREKASFNFDIARAKLDEAGHIADHVLMLNGAKLNKAIDEKVNLMLQKYGTYAKAHEAWFQGI